jgi:hypothetical protein
MKYQCAGCKRVFLHPAKKTNFRYNANAESEGTLLFQVEESVCPYCETPNLVEYMEPISSVKSVDIAEVDALLKQGYVIHELYAKTATLIKKEAKSA